MQGFVHIMSFQPLKGEKKHPLLFPIDCQLPKSYAAGSAHRVCFGDCLNSLSATLCYPFPALGDQMDVLSGFMSHRELVSVKQLSSRTLPAHMVERCGCECFQIAADKTKSLIWGRRTLLDCDRQGKTEGLLPISLWPGGHESSLREEGEGTLRGDWPDLETEQPLYLQRALTCSGLTVVS